MLIVCILLAALCFSLLVEAVQTLIHIDHQDTMHHPVAVIIIGACGLLLNGLTYLLIGGYTCHQGSFLHITPTGDVVLDRVATGDTLRDSKRSFTKVKRETGGSIKALPAPGKTTEPVKQDANITQTFREMLRDVCSEYLFICLFIFQ